MSEADHISIPWLERTVMDELTSVRGEIDDVRQHQGRIAEAIKKQCEMTKTLVETLTRMANAIEALRPVVPMPPPTGNGTTKRKTRRQARRG
jgi:hypothetical protein